MDREHLVNLLTPDDIFMLLEHLGAEPTKELNTGNIVALTICHDTDSPKKKLYYYEKNKNFYCYTHCHSIGNVVDLVIKTLNLEFGKAFSYLLKFFGIKEGYEKTNIEKLDSSYYRNVEEQKVSYDVIDDKVLKCFRSDVYYEDWVKEGISPKSMNKYNISLDIGRFFTIIPHYDKENRLIGIRRRAYLEEDIKRGKYTPLYKDNVLYNHSLGGNLYGLNHALSHIKDYRALVIFEGEKSVMQLDTFMKGEGVGVAVCGSNLTSNQINIIIDLILSDYIDEVVIGLDKEYEKCNTKQEQFYAQKIRQTFCEPLLPYCKVSVLWDRDNLLNYKDSPTDKGKDVYNYLFKNRIKIEEDIVDI